MKTNYFIGGYELQDIQGTTVNVNVPRNSWTDPTMGVRNFELGIRNCHAGEVSRKDAKADSSQREPADSSLRGAERQSCAEGIISREDAKTLSYAAKATPRGTVALNRRGLADSVCTDAKVCTLGGERTTTAGTGVQSTQSSRSSWSTLTCSNLLKYAVAVLICVLVSLGQAWGITKDDLTLITSISSLKTGDKVVIANADKNSGVSGQSSSDAQVSSTITEWVQYEVTTTGGGVKLKVPSSNNYIASPGGNEFKYGTTAGTCSVTTAGVLTCNSRYLCKNSSNYRFYSSIGSYTPFYVYKVTEGSETDFTGDGYVITFKKNSTANAQGSAIAATTTITDVVSTGASYISGWATFTKANYNSWGGVKLGTNNNAGTLKISLSNTGKVKATTIVVKVRRYNTGNAASIAVNGKTAQAIGGHEAFNDYTFTINANITYIELVTSGSKPNCLIESITVNTDSGNSTTTKTAYFHAPNWSAEAKVTNSSGGANISSNSVNYIATGTNACSGATFKGWTQTASYMETSAPSDMWCSSSSNVSQVGTAPTWASLGQTTNFYAVYLKDGCYSTSCTFNCTQPKTLTSITLSGINPEPHFALNGTFTMPTVTAHYSDNTSTTVTTATANVTNNDLKTAGRINVTISYTEGGVTKTAEYYITVDKGNLSLSLDANPSVKVNANKTLTLNGNAGNGTVTWTSSDTDVATVNANGVVTGLTEGTTTITASVPATANYNAASTTTTLSVQALTLYSVTLDAGAGSLTGSTTLTQETEDGTVTLPTATISCEGWSFAGWATSAVDEATTVAPTLYAAGSNYKPTSNCTLYAVYKKTEGGNGNSNSDEETWNLVIDASTLAENDVITFVSSTDVYYNLSATDRTKTSGKVAITTNNSNNWGGEPCIITNNVLTKTDDIQVFTLKKGYDGQNWAFLHATAGYLCGTTTSNKNYMKEENTLSNMSSFKISIIDGVATITVVDESCTKNIMKAAGNYNSGNDTRPVFSCYASNTTGTVAPAIYRKTAGSGSTTTYHSSPTDCSTPEPETKYYVAGNGRVFGNENTSWTNGWNCLSWGEDKDNKGVEMTQNSDGTYTYQTTTPATGASQACAFMIYDGSWETGSSRWTYGNLQNTRCDVWSSNNNYDGEIQFKTCVETEVTITFNPTDAAITRTVSGHEWEIGSHKFILTFSQPLHSNRFDNLNQPWIATSVENRWGGSNNAFARLTEVHEYEQNGNWLHGWQVTFANVAGSDLNVSTGADQNKYIRWKMMKQDHFDNCNGILWSSCDNDEWTKVDDYDANAHYDVVFRYYPYNNLSNCDNYGAAAFITKRPEVLTVTFTTAGIEDVQEEVVVDGKVTAPNAPEGAGSACEKTFVGWMEGTISGTQTDVPTYITAGTEITGITENKTYNAVFKTGSDGGNIELTKDNVHSAYTTDNADRDMPNVTGFKYYGCMQGKASGSNTATMIQMRSTSSGSVTSWIYNVSDNPLAISSIVITYSSTTSKYAKVYFGSSEKPATTATEPTTAGNVYTYTPASGATFFQIKNENNGVVLIDKIVINYAGEPTTYSTTCVQKPTMPTFTPSNELDEAIGGYPTGTKVKIATETEGAIIYYTTDGTTPTTESTQYNSHGNYQGIQLNATTTIKAIAVKDGESSKVATQTFVIAIPYTVTYTDNAEWNHVGTTVSTIYSSQTVPVQLTQIELAHSDYFTLPNTISVTMGGKEIAETDYTWNAANGTVQLNTAATGNIVVTITPVIKTGNKIEDFERQTISGNMTSTASYAAAASNANIAWEFVKGNLSSATGNNTLHPADQSLPESEQHKQYAVLRENSEGDNGYMYTTSPLRGLKAIHFKYNSSIAAGVYLAVKYATDNTNTNWQALTQTNIKATNTNGEVLLEIPSSVPTTDYYLRFEVVNNSATAQHDLRIDDISFFTDAQYQVVYHALDETRYAQMPETETVTPSTPENWNVDVLCADKTFVGWLNSEIEAPTDTKPAGLNAAVTKPANADVVFYAVYAVAGTGSAPTAYTVGNTGNYVIAAQRADNNKWFAMVGSNFDDGKIAGTEIAVDVENGVHYVTHETAEGKTWTLAAHTGGYGYTLNDGTKYISCCGKANNTKLSHTTTEENNAWIIETITGQSYFKLRGTTSATETNNSRGLLFQKNASDANKGTFAAYALSNISNDSYSAIYILPIGGTTYTDYSTTCSSCATPNPLLTLAADKTTLDFEVDAAASVASETATITVNGGNGMPIDYSISPEGATYSQVNPTTMQFAATLAGTYTLTARQAQNNTTDPCLKSQKAEIQIVVNPRRYTVTFKNDNSTIGEPVVVSAGESIPAEAVPATLPDACDDYEFEGWTASVITNPTTYTSFDVSSTPITQTTTLQAVFSREETIEGATAAQWTLVTDLTQIQVGTKYVIMTDGNKPVKDIDTSEGYNTGNQTVVDDALTFSNNQCNAVEGVVIFTCESAGAVNQYRLQAANRYLEPYTHPAEESFSSAKAVFKWEDTPSATKYWEVDSDGRLRFVESEGHYIWFFTHESGNSKEMVKIFNTTSASSTTAIHLAQVGTAYALTTTYTTQPDCGVKILVDPTATVVSYVGAGENDNNRMGVIIPVSAIRLDKANGSSIDKWRVLASSDNRFEARWLIDHKNLESVSNGNCNQALSQNATTHTAEAELFISYKPNAGDYNQYTEPFTLTILVGGQSTTEANATAKATIEVKGYALPQQFAIVATDGEQSFALPNNMSSSGTYTGIPVEVTNGEIANAPYEVVYNAGLNSPTGYTGIPYYRTMMQLLGNGDNALKAETNPKIKNGTNTSKTMWQITATDNTFSKFIIKGDTLKQTLSMSTKNDLSLHRFGTYTTSRIAELQIVPITNITCHYYPAPEVNESQTVINDDNATIQLNTTIYGFSQYNITQWQYRLGDTGDWIESSATIALTELTPSTDYTLFIRAKVEVGNTCDISTLAYNFKTTAATCKNAPTGLHATVAPNSAKIEWNYTGHTSSTIYTMLLYSDSRAEHPVMNGENAVTVQSEAGKKFANFTNLESGKTYYYRVYAGDNTECLSDIATFITNNDAFDIVAWAENSITIDSWLDEEVKAFTIEGRETGITGVVNENLATDLFFSKYYEATGNVKMLGIYNGTANRIRLDDVYILSSNGQGNLKKGYKGYTALNLAAYGHKQRGYIQPGEELIFFTYDGTSDRKTLDDCIRGSEDVDDWYEVTSSDCMGGQVLSYSGKQSFALVRGEEVIDVIGSTTNVLEEHETLSADDLVLKEATTSKPSWGDSDKAFKCDKGDNIKTENVDESSDDYTGENYGLSTNRCLLVRKKNVKNGLTAVHQNVGGSFTTLCSEWAGFHVDENKKDKEAENLIACDGLKYLGELDFKEYYETYVSIGGSEADNSGVVKDGENNVYTLNMNVIAGFSLEAEACKTIRLKLYKSTEISESNEIASQEVKVPIMITSTITAAGDAVTNMADYLTAEQKAAYKAYHLGKNAHNKVTLRDKDMETCADCDLVILDGAVLQIKGNDANGNEADETIDQLEDGTPIVFTARNVEVYAGGRLILDNHVLFNTLSIRATEDVVATANLQAFLHLTDDDGLHHDKRLTDQRWYFFSLPYDCFIEDVTFRNGNPAQYGTDWVLRFYNGQKRAENAKKRDITATENYWKNFFPNGYGVPSGVIPAGQGFLLGISGRANHLYRELRFPMAVGARDYEGQYGATTNGDQTRVLTVGAWGAKYENSVDPDLEGATKPVYYNNVGWNLIGVPYTDWYNPTRSVTVDNNNIVVQDKAYNTIERYAVIATYIPEKNVPTSTNIRNVRFAVTQEDGSVTDYGYRPTDVQYDESVPYVMQPFLAYFVQVPGRDPEIDGPRNKDQEYEIRFTPDGMVDHVTPEISAQNISMRRIYAEPTPANAAEAIQVYVDLRLHSENGEMDKTVFCLNDWFKAEYEVGSDMTRMRGEYTKATKPILASILQTGVRAGEEMVVQYLPDSSAQNIPLHYWAAAEGQFTFSLASVTSSTYLDHVYLYDSQENIYTDLLNSPYTFHTEAGDNTSRFYITVEVNRTPQVVDNLNEANLGIRAFANGTEITLCGVPNGVQVWIYSPDGKLCHSASVNASTSTFAMPAAGVYYVHVENAKGKQTIPVIVK